MEISHAQWALFLFLVLVEGRLRGHHGGVVSAKAAHGSCHVTVTSSCERGGAAPKGHGHTILAW
jgi:hypothetical protein